MRFSEEQKKEMVRLYKKGLSQVEIAGRLGAHGASVGRVLRRRGVKCRDTPKPFSDEETERVRKLYLSGMSVRDVGAAMNRRYQSVSSVVRRLGISRDSASTRRGKTPTEVRDKAIELYQAGKTLDEIEAALPITRAVIYRELKKRGIERRRSGARGRFHGQPEVQAKIAEGYSNGCSLALLAAVYQCSSDAIKKILKEAKVALRKEIPGQRGYRYLDRKQREHWFRSTWEIQTAQWFDKQQIDWDYEKETYQIGERKRYTPDFWIYDAEGRLEKLLDVKGWLYGDSEERISLFREQHPELPLEIWPQEKLRELGIFDEDIELPLAIENRGLRSRISKAEIQEAVRLYESGMTTGQVAEALNRSESAIARHLQKLGKTRDRYQTKMMLSADQETRDRVAEVYLAGNSISKTAEILGISRDVVAGEVARRGISRKRKAK
jgi:transposase